MKRRTLHRKRASPSWRAVACLACILMSANAPGTSPANTSAHQSRAIYPQQLHGEWLPPDVACNVVTHGDSDVLTYIDAERTSRYEDSYRITAVERIQETPATWRIDSMHSIGGDPPAPARQIYVLSAAGLVIVSDDDAIILRRCDAAR